MAAQRSRIAHQQQFVPCAGHAHVHAADVRQEADLALSVAARQGDGNDVALLALERIDGAHAEPALQQRVMRASKAPRAPRHWQSVGLFSWMACPRHFRCVPPRFESCPCVRPHRLASGPVACVLQSVVEASAGIAASDVQRVIDFFCITGFLAIRMHQSKFTVSLT